jgi:hypothetical protein
MTPTTLTVGAMDLYIFCLVNNHDVLAFTPTPESNVLPRGSTEDAWRLLRKSVVGEALPTQVPLNTIMEQISQYGYCIVMAGQSAA